MIAQAFRATSPLTRLFCAKYCTNARFIHYSYMYFHIFARTLFCLIYLENQKNWILLDTSKTQIPGAGGREICGPNSDWPRRYAVPDRRSGQLENVSYICKMFIANREAKLQKITREFSQCESEKILDFPGHGNRVVHGQLSGQKVEDNYRTI